jgi:DNA-binding MarR family transcriptional regulator
MSILTARDRANPGFLIRRIQQLSVSIFMSRLMELGITPLQYTVLRLLGDNPELDQVNIASLAGLDTSTTMDIVARLDDRGLIKRTRGLTDQRRRLAVLTAEGTELLDRARPLVEAAQRELLAPLNKRQQAAFLNAMCLLVEGHDVRSHAPFGKVPWRRAR